MTGQKAAQTRSKIIQAANQITLVDGINQLTLEAVAETAGISKGGLLYHFPSKETLIESMIDHYLSQFEARLERYLAQGTGKAGDWLRAYVQATFDTDEAETAISAGLMAAIAVKPELLQPMQARYRLWQQRLNTGHDPALSTIIRLAMDGLWVVEMLGMAPPDATLRSQILNRLLALSQELDA